MDNAYTFFMPGMLVQLGIFGAFFAGFSLIGEWREGVIEAERVTPASRTALLVGRLLSRRAPAARAGDDPGRARLRSWAWTPRSAAWSFGVVLTLLIGGACAASSNALALTTKSEDVMAPVINMVMMPVLLLSGILLPMTIGPQWLQDASDFMPIRHVVDAVRGAFGGDFAIEHDALGHGLVAGAVRARAVVGHPHVPQGERLTRATSALRRGQQRTALGDPQRCWQFIGGAIGLLGAGLPAQQVVAHGVAMRQH